MIEKKILVIGAARSGIALSNTLIKMDKEVTLYDHTENLNEEEIRAQLEEGVRFLHGQTVEVSSLLDETQVIALSPGVPTDLDFLEVARTKRIKILGEIEINYDLCKPKEKIIGITGTNGKTTTTTLVYEIVKAFDVNTLALGNIGTPFSKEVLGVESENIVLELSSFQLETIDQFRPHVSAVLNITPDHLDRHKTMEKYIQAKENIFKNQTAEDTLVLNFDDEVTRGMRDKTEAKVLFFSSKQSLERGAFLRGEEIVLKDGEMEEAICHMQDLQIIGMHNVENAMAAVLITHAYGVPIEIIREVLIRFQPVEHRIEYVRTLDGVKYYNDSKGTNPDSSIKAIRAMKGETIIIIGGYDKKISFDEFVSAFSGKVKLAIIIGQVRDQLVETCNRLGFTNYVCKDTFPEAVLCAHAHAKEGDHVLLSPACASWGMFNNYEERGKQFKELVNKL